MDEPLHATELTEEDKRTAGNHVADLVIYPIYFEPPARCLILGQHRRVAGIKAIGRVLLPMIKQAQ